MPNIRIQNSAPNIKAKSDVPQNRVSTMGSSTANIVTFGGPGYLIGMLGLTYTKAFTINTGTTVSDFKPNIRIRSN